MRSVGSVRTQVNLAYAAFVLVGVSAGVGGVLLPAQIADYGIDMTTMGVTFVTFSTGFLLAGLSTGWLVSRLGTAAALAVGGGAYVVATFATASRPAFAAFVALQLLAGYGGGTVESVLNSHLSGLPGATTLLNRLHAFFGVGALLGPLLAARLLTTQPWTSVLLVLGVVSVPLVLALVLTYPRRVPYADGTGAPQGGTGGLAQVLREPAVLLAGAFLVVYVGLEISVGSWGFTYLVQHEGQVELLAGYTLSGYWLGLTVGRFVISPVSTRLGLNATAMMTVCLAGVVGTAALAWAGLALPVTTAALVALGFFLGPLFPTAIAVAPWFTEAHRAPAAIGFMNGVSVLGGAALPWLAGAVAEHVGLWTLMPYVLVLAAGQLLVWRLVAARMRPVPVGAAAH